MSLEMFTLFLHDDNYFWQVLLNNFFTSLYVSLY